MVKVCSLELCIIVGYVTQCETYTWTLLSTGLHLQASTPAKTTATSSDPGLSDC